MNGAALLPGVEYRAALEWEDPAWILARQREKRALYTAFVHNKTRHERFDPILAVQASEAADIVRGWRPWERLQEGA